MAPPGEFLSLSFSYVVGLSLCRYDAHLMFSLCHGKLSEETARLALAREMVKVKGKKNYCVRKQFIEVVFLSLYMWELCLWLSLLYTVSGGVCQ